MHTNAYMRTRKPTHGMGLNISVRVVFLLVGIANAAILVYLLGRRQDWWGGLIPAEGPVVAGGLVACAAALSYYSSERIRLHNIAELELEQDKESWARLSAREESLRARFSRGVEQLANSESFTVRMAGAYTLSNLANDWLEFDNEMNESWGPRKGNLEGQICVDMLCAYLRSDTVVGARDAEGETSVRNTILGILSDNGSRWRKADSPIKIILNGAYLRGLNLNHIDLSGASLRGVDLSFSSLLHARLPDANLTGAKMRNADLRYSTFTGATLVRADLSGSKMAWSDFQGAQLSNATLNKASCVSANFSHSILRKAKLQNAKMKDCLLTECDLQRADATEADFTGANLQNAEFDDAVADCASFKQSDMSGACLRNCSLLGTGFTQANMDSADFAGAVLGAGVAKNGRLRTTLFKGAYIASARNLTSEQMRCAIADPPAGDIGA